MDTNAESYETRINMLNRQISVLTQELEAQKSAVNNKITPINKYNPFDNPTDYKGFCGDYSKIQPNIETAGYELPLEPDYQERKNIRRFYSIGSVCILANFLLTTAAGYLLVGLITFLLTSGNPSASYTEIYSYMRSTSIIAGSNMLIYLVMNLFTAFLGMKMAGIKPVLLIRTRNFSLSKAVQYCLITMFLWGACVYITAAVSDIFSKYGFSPSVSLEGVAETQLGFIVMTVYNCVIAPITEEIFFRGMLLRTFSKANQRFAVFATAVFFGLAHGNITQFILAFIFGIFLAHITLKHGSVLPSILCHMCANIFSTIISEFSGGSLEFMFIAQMMIIFFGLLGAVMLVVFRTSNKLPATTPKQSRRGFAVASGSWMFAVAFGAEVLYMFYTFVTNNI